MHGLHATTSKVENSAQGLSCRLKFVHAAAKYSSPIFRTLHGSMHVRDDSAPCFVMAVSCACKMFMILATNGKNVQ